VFIAKRIESSELRVSDFRLLFLVLGNILIRFVYSFSRLVVLGSASCMLVGDASVLDISVGDRRLRRRVQTSQPHQDIMSQYSRNKIHNVTETKEDLDIYS